MVSSLVQILSEIYKTLACPICGKKFKIGNLKIKGLIDQTLALQSICNSGHISLFMTNISKASKQESIEVISADDCLDFHKKIIDFKGDFQKLWKK